MNREAIVDYLHYINEHDVIDKLNVLYKMILPALRDWNYGKRFISKEEFLKDFDDWRYSEYEDHEKIPDFYLDKDIPNDASLDGKFFALPSYLFDVDTLDEIYLWVVKLHGCKPYGEDKYGRTNAVCKVSWAIPLKEGVESTTRRTLTSSVIVLSDERIFPQTYVYIVIHELSHFLIKTMQAVHKHPLDSTVDETDDPFTNYEFREFIADIVPYYVVYSDNTDKALGKFKEALYNTLNPSYSKLYEDILEYLKSLNLTI